jgi:hypothetical protein
MMLAAIMSATMSGCPTLMLSDEICIIFSYSECVAPRRERFSLLPGRPP